MVVFVTMGSIPSFERESLLRVPELEDMVLAYTVERNVFESFYIVGF
jgi:hypothetical protein